MDLHVWLRIRQVRKFQNQANRHRQKTDISKKTDTGQKTDTGKKPVRNENE